MRYNRNAPFIAKIPVNHGQNPLPHEPFQHVKNRRAGRIHDREITSEERRTHLAGPLKAGPRDNRLDIAILSLVSPRIDPSRFGKVNLRGTATLVRSSQATPCQAPCPRRILTTDSKTKKYRQT